MKSVKRLSIVAILLLAFGGLANATYLAQSEASGTPLICTIESLAECNTVAASPYANFLGIPLADFGVIFYSTLFILAALELFLMNRFMRRAIQVAAVVGIIASLYFTYIQTFLIGAFCIYCLISAVITVLVFALASTIEPVWKKQQPLPPPTSPRLSMPPTP